MFCKTARFALEPKITLLSGASNLCRVLAWIALLAEMPWFLFLILVAVLDALPLDVSCVRLDDIYWNSSNPIFRIDNTDHIIDVNKNNMQFEYDQVNLICPVYPPNTDEDDTEQYIIYNVSKEEYDTCTITNPDARVIAVCDKPHSLMYFTITFRSFTPQPGGLEFRPGQDYYFISTSSKGDLHSRFGGRCLSHNMRIIFKVCCDPSKVTPAPRTSTTSSPTIPTAFSPMIYTPPPTRRRTTPTTTTTSTKSPNPSVLKTTPVKGTGDIHPDKHNKKTESKDKHPNETGVKNEELVNSGTSWRTFSQVCIVLASLWTLTSSVLLAR